MRDLIDSLKYQAILAKIWMIVLLESSMVIKLLSLLKMIPPTPDLQDILLPQTKFYGKQKS